MSPPRIDKRHARAIGQRVKELRERSNLRQEELSAKISEEIEMSQQQLSKIERGLGNLPAHVMPVLCKTLQVTPNIFFYHYSQPSDQTQKLDDDVIAVAILINKLPPLLRSSIVTLLDEVSPQNSDKSKKSEPATRRDT